MTCPHLDYRRDADGRSFSVARAYCEVTGAFVQPLRADLCTDRYALAHERDCEIYREHEGLDDGVAAARADDDGAIDDEGETRGAGGTADRGEGP